MVHPIVDENRKENQKTVRIAILDTGVDFTHPQIQAALVAKRITACFPESVERTQHSESTSAQCCHDSHGHGTHVTSVLLRTAPNAKIYIAKVTENDGTLRYDDIVKVC